MESGRGYVHANRSSMGLTMPIREIEVDRAQVNHVSLATAREAGGS